MGEHEHTLEVGDLRITVMVPDGTYHDPYMRAGDDGKPDIDSLLLRPVGGEPFKPKIVRIA